MLNPIAEKENYYYYNFFKKSLTFLSAGEKKSVLAKLDTKYINSSVLVTQANIAQDTFRRIISSLNVNSTLNRIEFSDYGNYTLKVVY